MLRADADQIIDCSGTGRPQRGTWKSIVRGLVLTSALLSNACSLAEWGHTVELRADGDAQQFEVWFAYRGFEPNPYSILLDGMFFPVDIVLGTITAAKATWDPELQVWGGPAGWLMSLFPFVTVVPTCDPRFVTVFDAPRRGGPPKVFQVSREALAAVRSARDQEERVCAVGEAIAGALPEEADTHAFDHRVDALYPLTRERWRSCFVPAIRTVIAR